MKGTTLPSTVHYLKTLVCDYAHRSALLDVPEDTDGMRRYAIPRDLSSTTSGSLASNRLVLLIHAGMRAMPTQQATHSSKADANTTG